MFSTLVRRAAPSPIPPRLRNAAAASLPGIYSRYKPKKVWPPDFSKLSAKEQFRFERRYKRRVKLATARPRWDKYVRLAQLCSVTGRCFPTRAIFRRNRPDVWGGGFLLLGVLVYSLLFMEASTGEQPFQGVSGPAPSTARARACGLATSLTRCGLDPEQVLGRRRRLLYRQGIRAAEVGMKSPTVLATARRQQLAWGCGVLDWGTIPVDIPYNLYKCTRERPEGSHARLGAPWSMLILYARMPVTPEHHVCTQMRLITGPARRSPRPGRRRGPTAGSR